MYFVQQVNISPRLSERTTIGDYRHVWEFVRKDAVSKNPVSDSEPTPALSLTACCYCCCCNCTMGLGVQDTVVGYLATAAYATPQDPLFEAAPFKPLVLFFHTLTLTRRPAEGEGTVQ
jgi:hypothetical protein